MGGGTSMEGSGKFGIADGPVFSEAPGTGVGVGRNVAGPPLGGTTTLGVGAGWQASTANATSAGSPSEETSPRIGARRRVSCRIRRRV